MCALDLKGFDAELAVISGRRHTVEHMHRIMRTVGTEPSQWLPLFMKHFLQHGDVIRALHAAVRALENRPKTRSNRAHTPTNAGKPWTEEEDRKLLEQFDAGRSVAQLAQAHDRTPAGIHARLVRHGRLQGTGPQWRGRAATALASATNDKRIER